MPRHQHGASGIDLLLLLGFAVFERKASGSLRLLGEPPEWLRGFLGERPAIGGSEALVELFPYLEVFMPEAGDFWEGRRSGRLHSDLWTQTDLSGKECRLLATAVSSETGNFLFIEPAESLFAETQGFVQHAHDASLAYDKVAKLSRALAFANQQLELRNQEVERATQAKSEFLARMSHEIRTPMNAILGMADLLWESPLTPEQREYVRIFRRAGDNLLNLINDILDLSKVESGHMELEEVEFDLAEVLEKVCEVIAVRAHAKGLELSGRIKPDVPTRLIGDPGRLRQILLNLLGNSVKFTERGEVAVLVEAEPGSAQPGRFRFSVSDTGIGIPSDRLGSVFESFTQVDSSTTRKYGGSGLGLTISRKFVELMGGRIWAESVLGRGSSFRFTCNFRVQAVQVSPPPEVVGLHCLVADENANNREALRDLLASWGAVVSESADGHQALEQLRATAATGVACSLVLLSARIPGADSFQLAGLIQSEFGASTQVMMMLATDRPADAARSRELGLRTLLKPVRRSELLEVRRAGTLPLEAPAEAPTAPHFGGMRILLADDSEDNRFLIRCYLAGSGCVLDEAENGEIAVEKFKTSRYQLVLTDLEMPLLDGYEATHRMRAWEQQRGARPTPILALTAHAIKEHIQKSLDAGCDAHLTKPIKKAVLVDAISRYALKNEDGPVRVVVDASLEDLVPAYLEKRRKDIIALRGAVASSDFESIRLTGHSLKGTGGGYGFPKLTDFGAALESAALARNSASIRQNIEELHQFLENVAVEYR